MKISPHPKIEPGLTLMDTDAVKCVADVSAVKQKPHLFQLLIGKI
jgi:hypothetical protein